MKGVCKKGDEAGSAVRDDEKVRLAGVDGCKGGWFVASLDANGEIGSAVVATASELCHAFEGFDVAAVDVPIGLTDSGPRRCDQEARKALGAPRASSVFPPPARAVLPVQTREAASLAQERIDGRRIGVQAWGIFPKIREWDSCLRADARLASRVFEVHPEVSFWALNGFSAMRYGKKSSEGRSARRKLLTRTFGAAALDATRSRHARAGARDDDLHDAFAALWTARRIYEGIAKRLPESTPRDSLGLPMAIWY